MQNKTEKFRSITAYLFYPTKYLTVIKPITMIKSKVPELLTSFTLPG